MHSARRSGRVASAVLLASLTISCVSGCRPGPDTSGKTAISGPIAGNPAFNASKYHLDTLDYKKQEFFFSGTATSYKPAGASGVDGRWTVQPAATAPFNSRFVVLRPLEPAKFNGTVVVEWLNVTAGSDQPAEWTYIHRELIRRGYAYVGVSAQRVGIEGGPGYFGPGRSLKLIDAARYSRLHHPGDAFSYDIFTQAARRIRRNDSAILGALKPARLIAAGESQSAIFLTTYINAIDPIAKVFDGFLIHSRLGFASGLDGSLDGATQRGQPKFTPVQIRSDARVPVLMTITETDVLAPLSTYLRVRQPDSDHVRTWEIAGTSHADNYIFGLGIIDSGQEPIQQLAQGFQPLSTVAGQKLVTPINNGPQHHYVEQAAIRALNRWITEGTPPAHAPLLEVSSDAPAKFVLDAQGNVLGGIRSPWVDVPTSTLSGLGQPGAGVPSISGTVEPFAPDQLAGLYPGGKPDYLARFHASRQAAINAGFILPDDSAEITALAAESYSAAGK